MSYFWVSRYCWTILFWIDGWQHLITEAGRSVFSKIRKLRYGKIFFLWIFSHRFEFKLMNYNAVSENILMFEAHIDTKSSFYFDNRTRKIKISYNWITRLIVGRKPQNLMLVSVRMQILNIDVSYFYSSVMVKAVHWGRSLLYRGNVTRLQS